MAYELIWEPEGVVIKYSDFVSDADIQQANLDLFDDPRFEALKFEICDYTDVDGLDRSSEIVRWVAEFDIRASERNPSVRVAVVGEQPLLKGVTNMYRAEFELRGGKWGQGQFATVKEARIWLAKEDQKAQRF